MTARLLLVVDRRRRSYGGDGKGVPERDPRVRVIEVDHCSIPTKFAPHRAHEGEVDWITFSIPMTLRCLIGIERCLEAAQPQPDVVAWCRLDLAIRPDGRRFRMRRWDPRRATVAGGFPMTTRSRFSITPAECSGATCVTCRRELRPLRYPSSRLRHLRCERRTASAHVIPEPLSEPTAHDANRTSLQSFELQSKQFSYLWQRRARKDRGESSLRSNTFLAFSAERMRGEAMVRSTRHARSRGSI